MANGRSGRRCRAPARRATTSPPRSASQPAEMTVQPTLLGGGFGRKSKCDFAIEAALLSKELGGAPVKVVWTREDDVRHGFYHTVTAERFEAGLDASNKVIAWRHRSAAPTILSTFAPDPKHPFDIELGMGWVDTPFDVPNIRMESGEAQSHVRIGWFRSVNNVAHAWSIQSFVAEMAQPARQGPQGLPARADRPGAHRRPAQGGHHALVELRRAVRDLPDRHGAPAAASPSLPPRRPAGASSCRRGRGSALPRTAASSPTSPRWCTWWWATRARSPSPASIRPSTAAIACIPSGCARRSRARR